MKSRASCFSECRNSIADSRYIMHSEKCDLRKFQVANGTICSEEIVQRLANITKYSNALIDGLNHHADICSTSGSRYLSQKKSVVLLECLQTFFYQ